MDKGHDSSVLMLQAVRVCVTQCVVIFDNSVTADLTIAKQAKKWSGREHLVKSISFYIGLVVVVALASSNACKHEPQRVFLWNFSCLQPPNCCFSCLRTADVLVQEHRCPLHLRATQCQAHHTVRTLATATE